jgi:hypothetical protein
MALPSSSSSSSSPQNSSNSIYPPSPGAARRRPTAKMGRIDTSGMSFGAVYGLSCLSACVAETLTFPLDLVKTRVQSERMSTCVWDGDCYGWCYMNGWKGGAADWVMYV